jgi:hypothetical protein
MSHQPNAGKAWTDDEVARLLSNFQAGFSIYQLALQHQRSPNAIITRLIVHGRVAQVGKGFYGLPEFPFATFETIKADQARWLRKDK